MRTGKIIEALNTWSPHGLCENVLVLENGDKRITQACAVGAMALHVISKSKELQKLMRKENKRLQEEYCFVGGLTPREAVVEAFLYDQGNIDDDDVVSKAIREEMFKYYGLDSKELNKIMRFNDNHWSIAELPKKLKSTIRRLRNQYEDWMDKQEGR